jgi:hypothetical protein
MPDHLSIAQEKKLAFFSEEMMSCWAVTIEIFGGAQLVRSAASKLHYVF